MEMYSRERLAFGYTHTPTHSYRKEAAAMQPLVRMLTIVGWTLTWTLVTLSAAFVLFVLAAFALAIAANAPR